jgi:elongation factor Tu
MILATITLVNTEDGGRSGPIFSGYRPQFYFEGEDFECRKIDMAPKPVFPGETAEVRITLSEYATATLTGRVNPGDNFELHEGKKSVASGVVTGIL